MSNSFRHPRHWVLRLALGVAVALASLGAVSARAQAQVFTESIQVPYNDVSFVGCANGGAGEYIVLTGTLHLLFQYTINGSGGIHVTQQVNPQNVIGVGVTTGTEYRATGMGLAEYTLVPGVEMTFVNNYRLIGRGPGNNLLVHTVQHITINANGELTVFFSNSSIECR